MLKLKRPFPRPWKIGNFFLFWKRKVHNSTFIKVRSDIKEAVLNQQPVVALESTIITHGMPYPHNLNTALQVENVITKLNAIPATIGIIDGQMIVGLTNEEIKYLSDQNTQSMKISRRDLSYALSMKHNGGTTVSATMLAAHWAGIQVFVTGGIGGVHRGAAETFDISADLKELGRTPVAVVCAGIKSILDIGLTLEYLETEGVPVLTFGRTKDFPSFFTPSSKFKAPYNLESIEDIAKMIYQQKVLELNNGIIIGVPIPKKDAAEGIEEKIEEALVKAKENKISGKDITPYVLEYISNASEGQSLKANVALIKNNAEVGAKIAVALSHLRKNNEKIQRNVISNILSVDDGKSKMRSSQRPVVLGGTVFDIKATADQRNTVAETTNSGKIHLSVGGVGRNIAECLSRLDSSPYLISSVGNDFQGDMIIDHMKRLDMDTTGVHKSKQYGTASYSIMADEKGELVMTVGDMTINDSISKQQVSLHEEIISSASILVLDANLPEETIKYSIDICNKHNVPVWFEPTSFEKASKPFMNLDQSSLTKISYASPNLVELKAIYRRITGQEDEVKDDIHMQNKTQAIDECLTLIQPCLTKIDNIFITLGKHGVVVVQKKLAQVSPNDFTIQHYPAHEEHMSPVNAKSVSGAGDSFASGVIFGILQNHDLDLCVKSGLLAAYTSLQSYTAISGKLNKSLLSPDNVMKWASFSPTVIQN